MPVITPCWDFAVNRRQVGGYLEARLAPAHVVGTWFCLDRESGTLLWQRSHHAANTIRGIVDGVIVATEGQFHGPMYAEDGVYRIGLHDGLPRAPFQAPGCWCKLTRLLDWVPGFTNESRDTVFRVGDGAIFTNSGRVLDPTSGEEVGRVEVTKAMRQQAQSPFVRLLLERRLNIGEQGTLYWGKAGIHEEPVNSLNTDKPPALFLEDANGALRWCWEAPSDEMGLQNGAKDYVPNVWQIRLHQIAIPFAYLIEESERAEVSSREPWDIHCRAQLLTLDLRTGQFLPPQPFDANLCVHPKVEDADDSGVLVRFYSSDNRQIHLRYFTLSEDEDRT